MDLESIKSVFALFECFKAILYVLLIVGPMFLVYQSDSCEAIAGVGVYRGKRDFERVILYN